jgi:amino acid adenylation domain-containing protein
VSTRELLATLAARGVTLSVHGDALRVRAPQGALDAELQAELARHKPELIRMLGAAGGAAPASATPVRRDGPLPLSSSQQRLWFLDRLRPDSRAYALAVAFELEGTLDAAALRASLDGLVARHEILRTTFGDTEGVPWQRIGAPAPADFTLEDLAGLPAGERLPAARRRAAEWGERPFDLGSGPLFRAGLLRLAPDRWVLVLALHHIVYDGWSLGVLYDELAALYAAQVQGRAAELPPPAVQFADFAAWERGALQGPALAALLEHWRARLRGLAPLELSADRPRPARQGLNGRTLELPLPAALVEGLSALGRRQGATLYMTLLAGFTALLQRDTGERRLAVGAPVANRERTEHERLVGPCLNLLVLATDLSGAPTFLELLERVRATTVDALAHQALPFEKLVEALAPERDRSRHPLVQVAFALHGAERAPALEGLAVRPLDLPRATTVFDLAVDVFEQAGGLRAVLTYDSDLFDAGTVRTLGAAWRTLLEQALADPGRAVGELPLLTADERRQWLAGLDATATAYPEVGVQVLVERQAQRTPQAVAVECAGRRLGYAELDARANRIAQVLRERGVRRGVLVGVCLDRDADLLAALLAIMKAGGAYVPLDPGFPPERLAFMLADCRAPVLLTRVGLLETLETLPPAVVRLDADAARIDAARAVAPPDGAGPDDLAYVIYTSGSTGRPKGVCVAHRSVVNLLTSMAREPGLGAADVLTAVTTISFDIAGLELFLPLSVGARVVLAPREVAGDGRRLARLLADSGTTIMQATPATWLLLLQSGWSDPSVRRLCGGEALPRPLAQRLLEGGAELWNVYGPTETTIWSAVARVEPGPGPVPIGRPIANTRMLVLDAQRQALPAGVPGELYIGGDGVARGYLGRDELTAERFVPDPFRPAGAARLYRTGDRVRQRADGALEFLGRLDGQVKLRGFRIELGEIEAVLGEQPQVAEAAVLLREDRAGDPRLVAYVTARDPVAGVALDALRAGLLARLPEYMVPAVFVVLDELPRTPNRKVDRRALPAPDGARRSSAALIPPRTALEREVAAIWAGLLGLDAVGLRDDFFALGGHSLLATQLVSRLRDRLGVEVPLARVFETPTLEGLCPWIEAERAGPPRAALPAPVPVPRGDDLPLSFAQQRLWFLDQMGAGAAYAVPLALQWSGRLDRDALRHALSALVERHESLRTRFPVVEGRPRQVIAPPFELRLDVSDLTPLDAPARERERARLAAEEAERPFDLAAGPLIRARLAVLGPAEHVLLLTLHHVICDGWSLGVLFRELAELYRAACEGRAPELPALAVQYADFAVWQRQALAGDALAAQLLYWKRRLGSDLTTLELAADRRRPAAQSFAGACWRFRLGDELTGALESLARAEGVTLAMLLLGAFGALLARDSGQEDVAVGSPIANRTRSELEPLIGFFANSLVLRLDLSGDPAFRELVRRVQRISLDAYAHQDLPFERLVDELQPERSLGHNPLFQVVFAMQDAVPAPAALPDVTLAPLAPVVTRTRTDLELHLRPVDGGLEGLLVYATDLFDESTVARLARRYASILAGAVADPACRLSRLPVLEDDERRRILRTWNETAMPFAADACLHELIEQRAAEAPGSTALVHGSETLSYGELDERANRVAHALRAMGVGHDRLVGLCLERGTAMIVGLLGILKAGGAWLPLDPGYPRERLAFMLADSGAAVLVTTAALAQRLPAHGAALLCLDRDAERIAAAPASNPGRVATPSSLAYAIYTSGSTGTPKCALLEHRGLCSLSEAQRRLFGVGPHSRVLQFSSLSFDAATFEIVMALPKGATLVLGDRHALLPGPDLLAVLQEQRISIVTLTPTALAALPAAALPDLATITVAGEACPPELVARWAPGRRLFNLYGPTETTIWATAAELKAGEPVHIGRPVGNVELYLLDAQGEPVPVGVPGEIHIGGVGLARGYHGRPELTAERFIAHPFRPGEDARLYRTGDRGRFRPDGSVEFLGRLDSQVKLRGHRIELGEIEAALAGHPAVRESLAVLREDAPGARRIVAYVVDDPGVEVGGDAEQESSLAAAHVAHWQSLYDETYAGTVAGAGAADPTFDVSGWNSSYTGQPIEPAQMREWVERTVEQVAALAPRRLLEIGCGSGLLLFRLAPRCESYVGTDFSAAAIEAVGGKLRLLGDAAGRVRLLQRTAHDLHGLPEGGFDTVLLNSVVQYFPGADYLLAVVEQALRLVGETGRIVIGDVRSLPLLPAFHASVQLHRAADDAPLDALRRQAHALANLDQELVVHPGLVPGAGRPAAAHRGRRGAAQARALRQRAEPLPLRRRAARRRRAGRRAGELARLAGRGPERRAAARAARAAAPRAARSRRDPRRARGGRRRGLRAARALGRVGRRAHRGRAAARGGRARGGRGGGASAGARAAGGRAGLRVPREPAGRPRRRQLRSRPAPRGRDDPAAGLPARGARLRLVGRLHQRSAARPAAARARPRAAQPSRRAAARADAAGGHRRARGLPGHGQRQARPARAARARRAAPRAGQRLRGAAVGRRDDAGPHLGRGARAAARRRARQLLRARRRLDPEHPGRRGRAEGGPRHPGPRRVRAPDGRAAGARRHARAGLRRRAGRADRARPADPDPALVPRAGAGRRPPLQPGPAPAGARARRGRAAAAGADGAARAPRCAAPAPRTAGGRLEPVAGARRAGARAARRRPRGALAAGARAAHARGGRAGSGRARSARGTHAGRRAVRARDAGEPEPAARRAPPRGRRRLVADPRRGSRGRAGCRSPRRAGRAPAQDQLLPRLGHAPRRARPLARGGARYPRLARASLAPGRRPAAGAYGRRGRGRGRRRRRPARAAAPRARRADHARAAARADGEGRARGRAARRRAGAGAVRLDRIGARGPRSRGPWARLLLQPRPLADPGLVHDAVPGAARRRPRRRARRRAGLDPRAAAPRPSPGPGVWSGALPVRRRAAAGPAGRAPRAARGLELPGPPRRRRRRRALRAVRPAGGPDAQRAPAAGARAGDQRRGARGPAAARARLRRRPLRRRDDPPSGRRSRARAARAGGRPRAGGRAPVGGRRGRLRLDAGRPR